MNLTQAQYDQLSLIAHSGATGSRVSYYTKLAEFGISYGNVGLGVALEHQLSGAVANAFFMAAAADEGVSVSGSQWQAIGQDLMIKDLDERFSARQDNGNGEFFYPDLSYYDIRDYHQASYDTLGGTVPSGQGVSLQAWTAYAPVEDIGLTVWTEMLADTYWDMTKVMARMVNSAFVDGNPDSMLWFTNVVEIWDVVFNQGSPLMFPDEVEGAEIILGTLEDDAAALFVPSTTTEKKMFLGLGGDDVFDISPAPQHDRYYDGGDGDDTFRMAGAAAGWIHGGRGEDVLDISSSASSVMITLNAEDAFSTTSPGMQFSGIERVLGGSDDDEFIFTVAAFETGLYEISGGAGSDTLYLAEAPQHTASDRLLDLRNYLYGNAVEVYDIENVIGSANADIVYGDEVANIIAGLSGNDTLYGDEGDDFIRGGDGDDRIWGEVDNDILYGDGGHDVIYGGDGRDSIYGGAGNDQIYAGQDADWVSGGSGDDVIRGESGNDVLYGNGGWDTLDGGDGGNILTGGVGGDTFVFGFGTDFVMDFLVGVDRLRQHNPGILTMSQEGADVVLNAGVGQMYLVNAHLQDILDAEASGLLWA